MDQKIRNCWQERAGNYIFPPFLAAWRNRRSPSGIYMKVIAESSIGAVQVWRAGHIRILSGKWWQDMDVILMKPENGT